jgi:hypothetical protein
MELSIDAEVDETFLGIHGTVCGAGPEAWLNPLADLPWPDDDLTWPRTAPGRGSRGEMTWAKDGEDCIAFQTRLPERYGAMGGLEGRGLWANGGWYPQPVRGDSAPPVNWQVELVGPEGAVLVVNDAVGQGAVQWTGQAFRVAISVLKDGEIKTLSESGLETVLVSERQQARPLEEELSRLAQAAWTLEQPGRVVVVVAPLYRRLVRAGPGVLFVSELAFRVSPSLHRYHRAPVAQGLLEAALPLSDPWHRAMAAEALGQAAAESVNAGERQGLLDRLGLPGAHTLLYDGRTLFLSDVFGEALQSDPLADDLLERVRPRVPGALVAHWVRSMAGEAAAEGIAQDLLAGESLPDAFVAQGLDGELAVAWQAPMPAHDLILAVEPGVEPRLWMERRVEEDAAPVPVVVDVDGEREVWLTDVGPDWRIQAYDEKVRRVWIDPDRHVPQVDRANDRWPRGVSLIPGIYLGGIHLTERRFEGVAWTTIRRPYNTHRLAQVVVVHDARSVVSLETLLARYVGPYRDRMRREHLVWLSGAGGLLEEEYRPTEEALFHVDLGVGYAWDTRVTPYFPEKGRRLWIDGGGGMVPESDSFWLRGRLGARGVRAVHPRHAFAGRASFGWMRGNLTHRMLGMGGSGGLTSVPSSEVLGRRRASLAGEYRVLAARNLSLHVPFWWITDVQLSAGVEAGWLDEEDLLDPIGGVVGVGGTLGLSVVADTLGIRPALGGITVSRLVWQEPEFYADPQVLVMLRISQLF